MCAKPLSYLRAPLKNATFAVEICATHPPTSLFPFLCWLYAFLSVFSIRNKLVPIKLYVFIEN
jgi:hypothetical protein